MKAIELQASQQATTNRLDNTFPPSLMQILQYNCNHSQATCIAAFKPAKIVRADILYILEPYVGGGVLKYTAYEIQWRMVGEQKEQRVAIGIAISKRNSLLMEAWMDIIIHPYIQVMDIQELKQINGNKKRRKGIVNVYYNHLQR